MTEAQRQKRLQVITAFALVYVLWGSTYLGIRLAVEHVGPSLMAGVRFVVAGLIMLGARAVMGKKISITRADFFKLAAVGILLLSVANVVLAWAELYVPTGLAALIIASVPLWFLVIDTWLLKGDHVSPRGVAGLLLGIAGLAVLLWPKLQAASSGLGKMQLIGALSLLFSSLSWAVGSVLSKRFTVSVDVYGATGWEMLIAGVVNVVVGTLLGQHHTAVWTAKGLGAIAYLVVFGSLIGFTAYIWLLEHVATAKVATYAYVNPVVALFLGWLVLGERIDGWIMAGSVVIVAAVALVTSARVRPRTRAPEHGVELPAVEAAGD